MTNQPDLLKVLSGQAVNPPPIWLMRQAGRYLPEYRDIRRQAPNFLEFCLNPDLAVEATLQPLRRYPFDAAILFADILVIPHALGLKVEFLEGEGPHVQIVDGAAELSLMDNATPEPVWAPIMETVRRLRAELPPQTALIGFAGAPWTVATYMLQGRGGKDKSAARKVAWDDPGRMDAVLERLTDATIAYLAAQAEAGAQALKIFDSWADGLSPPLFDHLVIAPTRRIVAGLRARGIDTPIIGFPRGCGWALSRYVNETGVDGVAVDTGVSLSWARSQVPDTIAIQGCLDPVLLTGSGRGLESEIDRLLDEAENAPYIFNLGHGITPDADPELVKRVVDRVKVRG
ncbi:MAG: uroporphyrinogen decarboxylase [Maricaulaceae bacterium]